MDTNIAQIFIAFIVLLFSLTIHEMAEMQSSRRTHARDDTRFGIHCVGRKDTIRRYGGTTM